MKFIDEIEIEVIAGNGGNGIVSFRREKFIPFGGPNGGDGGRGGSIYAIANNNINTLINYRYNRLYKAKNGEHGRGSDQYGSSGKDIFLQVPVGTIIHDLEKKVELFDMSFHEQKVMLAAGGKGGLGNLHFKSSTNRAPRQRTMGKAGEQRQLLLELKILADVGLIGLPNSGKSTFISKISNARPKISSYPFTTLSPNLGLVKIRRSNSFVVADIPGLIEGASRGSGLGHSFLRHVDRTRILLHLIDVSFSDNIDINTLLKKVLLDIKIISDELRLYKEDLMKKPRWLVFTKIDLFEKDDDFKKFEKKFLEVSEWKDPIFFISSFTGNGISNLIEKLEHHLNSQK